MVEQIQKINEEDQPESSKIRRSASYVQLKSV